METPDPQPDVTAGAEITRDNAALFAAPCQGSQDPACVPIKPGIRNALVERVDFPATVEGLTGITPQHTHFGRSLLPVISGETGVHRDAVFCEGGRLHGETHCMELESSSSQASTGLYWPRVNLQTSEGPDPIVHHLVLLDAPNQLTIGPQGGDMTISLCPPINSHCPPVRMRLDALQLRCAMRPVAFRLLQLSLQRGCP